MVNIFYEEVFAKWSAIGGPGYESLDGFRELLD